MAHDADHLKMNDLYAAGDDSSQGGLLAGDSAALHCLHTSSVIVRNQGQALSIDFNEYHAILYSLMNRIPLKGRADSWVKTMQILLLRDNHLDKSRVAAFVKRLGILALHQPHNLAISFICIAKELLQSNRTVLRLLDGDNDGQGAGGVYRPDIDSPEHCNALASCVWEQCLLQDHFHPIVRKIAGEVVSVERSRGSKEVMRVSKKTPLDLFEHYDSSSGEFNPVPFMPRQVSAHLRLKAVENFPNMLLEDEKMFEMKSLAVADPALSAHCCERLYRALTCVINT